MSFSDFIDERMLISKNVLGTKEMKIKVIEVSDETTPMQWKFGDRVKDNEGHNNNQTSKNTKN